MHIILLIVLLVLNSLIGPVETEDLQPATRGTMVAAETTTTTTTTTTVPLRWHHTEPNVDRWYNAAIAAGWTEEQWPRLACIIYRESRGEPDALNIGPVDNSYGLIQANMLAHRKLALDTFGSNYRTILHDGPSNLYFGRILFDLAVGYYGDGWRPWIANDGSCR
jgi:hypothetical protein